MADPHLVAYLTDLGASPEQLADLGDDDLIGLAGDLQLAAGLGLDLDALANETGCSADEVRSVYGMLGLRPEDLAGFGEDDVALVSLITGDASGVIDEVGAQILRVAGTLLARLAEACVAAYVQDVELQGDVGPDLLAMANQNAMATSLALALGDHLPTVFRHQMWTAVRRQRVLQAGVADREIVRLAIGFVDLVGFTSLSRLASPAELIGTIEEFERSAFESASRHGGRIIKSIGDEVMVAASDATVVAAIALDLIGSIGDDPSVSPRGGVSAGEVLFRLGDYYGPVVNLAARLAAEAVPGEVLTDQPTMNSPDLLAQPAGRRSLKGFVEPVAVWTIAGQ